MTFIPPAKAWTLLPPTVDDLPSALEMFNLCSLKMVGTADLKYDVILNEWTAPHMNLAEDVRIAVLPDGQVVGAMEVWNSSPYVRSWLWGRVHPAYEGQGIGTDLLHWGEARARENVAKAERDTHITMQLGTYPNPLAEALFGQEGFTHIRYSFTMKRTMTGPPEPPEVPQGIVIRPIRAPEEYEAIHRAETEAFRDHWGYILRPFEASFRDLMHSVSDPTHDPSLWYVAIDGDDVAGLILCKMHLEETAWITIVAVRKPWRKRGLGLALLYHAFGEIYRRGQRTIQLDVDAENLTGALRLYQRAGMDVYRQFALYEKVIREGREIQTR